MVVSYVHNAAAPGLGKIGVLVALESAGDKAALEALGKQLAMHIAAANPLALRGEELDPALVERERAIAQEKAAETGKPAEIVDKMVDGAIAKFRKENALLSQLFVIDNKTKVEDVVAAGRPRTPARRSRSRPMSASSSAKASRRRKATSPPKSRAAAGTAEGRAGRLIALAGWRAPIKVRAALLFAPDTTVGSLMTRPRFNRILLKLSGEVLMGESQFGIDPADGRARSPRRSRRPTTAGSTLCLVIGGGNIFRGMAGAAKGIDRASADYMGMLATVMNALAMQNALEQIGVDTRVQSAIPMATGVRALYPPPRRAAPGEGPGGDLRRRHRQSLLHHRHRRRAARRRDGLRRAVQGHQRRRGLRCRSQEGAGRKAFRNSQLTTRSWRTI